MALKTTDLSGLDKKQKIAELKKKHEPLFKKEGVTKINWFPKMAYTPSGGNERVISLFPSEIKSGDVYTEFVSREYDPEDPERRLYKWEFNPHYDTEYEKTEPHAATGHPRYLIPVDELVDVANYHASREEPKDEQSEIDFPALADKKDDSPIGEMTIRDKAAIEWKLPVSRKRWLNDLIKEQFNGRN